MKLTYDGGGLSRIMLSNDVVGIEAETLVSDGATEGSQHLWEASCTGKRKSLFCSVLVVWVCDQPNIIPK